MSQSLPKAIKITLILITSKKNSKRYIKTRFKDEEKSWDWKTLRDWSGSDNLDVFGGSSKFCVGARQAHTLTIAMSKHSGYVTQHWHVNARQNIFNSAQ